MACRGHVGCCLLDLASLLTGGEAAPFALRFAGVARAGILLRWPCCGTRGDGAGGLEAGTRSKLCAGAAEILLLRSLGNRAVPSEEAARNLSSRFPVPTRLALYRGRGTCPLRDAAGRAES